MSDPLHASQTRRPGTRSPGWCLRVEPGRPRPSFLEAPGPVPGASLGPGASADDGGVSVFLDGELRAGDARIVLDRYRTLGIDGLGELRGRFALVLVDRESRLVIAQRDSLGHRPLFWARSAGGAGAALLLSDSIDVLLDSGDVSRDFDRSAVAGYLANRWLDPDRTFYRSIRRVRPGFRLIVRPEDGMRVEEERWWRLTEPDRLAGDEAERFAELFDRVVARSAGPPSSRRRAVGISLSSGLDSTSVATSAADAAAERGDPLPRAFCLGFAVPECDERHDQRRIAELLGLEATFLPAPLPTATDGPLHELIALAPSLPAPPVNPLLPAFRRLYGAARHADVATVLTGNGGDEWLGVTPLLGADLLRAGRWRQLWELGRSTQRSVRLPAAQVWWNQLWRFGARPLLADAAARTFGPAWRSLRARRALARMPAWLRPEVARELAERVRVESPRRTHRSFYRHEIARSVDHPLVATTREEVFDSARRTGVAVHAPFEDDEMVEHLAPVPPAELLQGGRSKGPVREYLRDRLHGRSVQSTLDLCHQRKVGFTRLFRDSVRWEAEDCLARLGGFEALADLGLVEPKRLCAAVAGARGLRTGSETLPIWSALVTESWLRREATGVGR